jgi:DNA invertase Pin-like site-specific DNA recombinase
LEQNATYTFFNLDNMKLENNFYIVAKTVDLALLKESTLSEEDIKKIIDNHELSFACKAWFNDFERELIRERTQAGLKSARARGRKGGRPKGMTQTAIEKAGIAEALYKNGSILVKKIAEQLGISKITLYSYLRYRNVDIGVMPKL